MGEGGGSFCCPHPQAWHSQEATPRSPGTLAVLTISFPLLPGLCFLRSCPDSRKAWRKGGRKRSILALCGSVPQGRRIVRSWICKMHLLKEFLSSPAPANTQPMPCAHRHVPVNMHENQAIPSVVQAEVETGQ